MKRQDEMKDLLPVKDIPVVPLISSFLSFYQTLIKDDAASVSGGSKQQ